MHLVLLGDSIFDNAVYTRGDPSVEQHLKAIVGPTHRVTLLARDGDVTAHIPGQLQRLPADATHLLLSVGGNDALGFLGVFDTPVDTVGEALDALATVVDLFQERYHQALSAVVAGGLPSWVCTIYNGAFQDFEQPAITTAVRLFDDVIHQAAWRAGVPVIELRQVCTEPDDYFNPIEPGGQGGRKIAEALARAVGGG